jgi:diguanylate cyclase (GGDEF)-like protein
MASETGWGRLASRRRNAAALTVRWLSHLRTRSDHEREHAAKTITLSLFAGSSAAVLFMSLVHPDRYVWLVTSSVLAIFIASGVSYIAARRSGSKFPAPLIHAEICLTTAVISIGAIAYSSHALDVAGLSFYIWGSISMFTLLPRGQAFLHAAVRIGATFAVLLVAHIDAAQIGPIIAIGILFSGLIAAQMAQRLHLQALIDPLTGCPNRQALGVLIGHELAAAKRSNSPFSVALLDLDNFKEINDTNGHAAGDRVLVEVSKAWRSLVRPGDIVARFAGDEFVVVLPECRAGEATIVLNRLVNQAGQTCSIGVVEATSQDSVEELLRLADVALYEAKDAGRSRVVRART